MLQCSEGQPTSKPHPTKGISAIDLSAKRVDMGTSDAGETSDVGAKCYTKEVVCYFRVQ
jgi:hypothetical protein